MPKPEITLVNKKLIAVLDTLEYEQRKPSEDRDYTRAQELFEQCLTESKLTSNESKVLPYLRGFFAANNSEFHTAAEWIANHCLDWDVPQMRLQKSAGQFHYYIEGRRINEELPVPYLTLPAFTNAQAALMLLNGKREHALSIARKKGLCLGLGGVKNLPAEMVGRIKEERSDLAKILWPTSLAEVLLAVSDVELDLIKHVTQDTLSDDDISVLKSRNLLSNKSNILPLFSEAKFHPLLDDKRISDCFQLIRARAALGKTLDSSYKWSVKLFLQVLVNLAPLEVFESFKQHMLEDWPSVTDYTSVVSKSATEFDLKNINSYSVILRSNLVPQQEIEALMALPDDCLSKLMGFLYELYSNIRQNLVNIPKKDPPFKRQVLLMLVIGNLFMRVANIARERNCAVPQAHVLDLVCDGFSMVQDLQELNVKTPRFRNSVKLPFENCSQGQPVDREQELVCEYARALMTASQHERTGLHAFSHKVSPNNEYLQGYKKRLEILLPAQEDRKQKTKAENPFPKARKVDRYHHLMHAFECQAIDLVPSDKEQKFLINGQSVSECIQQLQLEFDVFKQCFLSNNDVVKGKTIEVDENEEAIAVVNEGGVRQVGEALHAMASLLLNSQSLSEQERGQLKTIRNNLLSRGFEYQRRAMHEEGVSPGRSDSTSFGSVETQELEHDPYALELQEMSLPQTTSLN